VVGGAVGLAVGPAGFAGSATATQSAPVGAQIASPLLASAVGLVGGFILLVGVVYLLSRLVSQSGQGSTSESAATAPRARESQDTGSDEGEADNGRVPKAVVDEQTAPTPGAQQQTASEAVDATEDTTGDDDGNGPNVESTDDSTPSAEDEPESDHTAGDTDTAVEKTTLDEQMTDEMDAAEEAISTAEAVPVVDTQRIERQLARAHSHYIRAAELSSTADQADVETVRADLVAVEEKLDALESIQAELAAARDATPAEDSLSRADPETLRTAVSRYDDVIETATDAGFDTTQIEATRGELVVALDERDRTSTQRDSPDATPVPPSRQDVSYSQNVTNGQDATPAGSTNGSNSGADEAPQTSSEASDERATVEDADHELLSPQKENYVAAIERTAAVNDGAFSVTAFETESGWTAEDVIDEFGSWPAAIEAADVDVSTWLLTEIRALETELGHEPRRTEMNLHGPVGVSVYADQFGSYDEAVDAVRAAAEQEETTQSPRDTSGARTSGSASRSDYVDAIERVAEDYDGVLKTSVFDDRTAHSSSEIIREFGSWTAALDAAGVDRGERLLSELRRVGAELGHPPSTTEMNRHGRVSAGMYNEYFGSFTGPREQVFSDAVSNGATTSNEAASEPEPELATDATVDDTSAAATYARIADIESSARLGSPIAVRLDRSTPTTGDRKDAAFDVSDLDGDSCRINVWSKHDVRADWSVGHWYILEQARGKVWDSDGGVQRFLSSTKDMHVTHVGHNPPDEPVRGADWVGDTAESSTATSAGTEHANSASETTDGATADSATQTPVEESPDDILGDVVSEFDDV
jgi:hypothetical protein